MPSHRVVWTESAAQDLEEIIRYIAQDSPENAKRILKRLRKHADGLAALPNRGQVVPELRELGLKTWRQLHIRPWRIIYRVSGETVVIEVLLDGRRDASSLLSLRLLRR